MPRIRCHYEGCIRLESNYCSADVVELDPELGCLTFAQESEALEDEEDWDDELLEDDEWEEFDEEELEDDLDLDDEDEDDW